MRRLISSIAASALGLWLATMIVPEVHVRLLPTSSFFGFHLTALWQIYVILGIVVGLLHYFAKPILNIITLPLRILTLGLVGLIIDAGLIWVVTIIFPELHAPLWFPLIWTVIVIGVANFFLSLVVGTNE